jgi:hypothetical protein
MTREHDRDGPSGRGHDQDHGHDRDDQRGAVASSPAKGALASTVSLEALSASLNSVDTSAFGGRSGLPMMLFKREGSGTYVVGQKKVVVEAGSCWAINPTTFCWGYISFSDKVHERLVSISKPKPDIATLPKTGAEWQDEMTVNMKCVSGIDEGLEVVFKATTDGGLKEVMRLLEIVRDRINSREHDGKIAPIARLLKDSYTHLEYGRVWFPVLEIDEWVTLDGPETPPPPPAPEPAPAPTGGPTAGGSSAAEQPRRRQRVA